MSARPRSFYYLLGNFLLLLFAGNVAAAARLSRGPMEEARSGRHAHQRRYLRSAARLAVDHNSIGITPEI